jgi:outer membrane receptor protein involved in Fe transport
MLMSTTAFVAITLACASPSAVSAQTTEVQNDQQSSAATVEDIVVTGTRITRQGYDAPTPTTIVGKEVLERTAETSLSTVLNAIPAISGSSMQTNGSLSYNAGLPGVERTNLRSLGANRVLVLLDGQRVVGSTNAGDVDISNLPSQLISRIDVVTGGASAVYGSDAVAGVVNFVLDKEFTGLKGEISGGETSYGDNKNYKVNLTSGFRFNDGRGRVLLSGEYVDIGGVRGDGGRSWNRTGLLVFNNPAYTTTNGQPRLLLLPNGSAFTATAGGIVVSGPLRGTAFGPGGTPYQFQYGPLQSSPFMQGGDWANNDFQTYYDLLPKQTNLRFFGRASYELTNNLTVSAQYGWSRNTAVHHVGYVPILGGATGPVIRIDNPFIPASVRAAMVASNLTSFQLGTYNTDWPQLGADNKRTTNRVSVGLDGKFNLFDKPWTWNAYYTYGSTKAAVRYPNSPTRSRYALAIDAVVDPATGQIVCRSVLLGANNGCLPWNAMGTGVNDTRQAAFDWINQGGSAQDSLIEQEVFSASVTGEPFSIWAGPVSVSLSAEHRKDKIVTTVDAASRAFDHFLGNLAGLDGHQSVSEAAFETVIPLAKDQPWAKQWDINAAMRATDYQLAGYVTTWKIGTTYALNDDIKFRVTRSRDIRAPTLLELFAQPAATSTGTGVSDRFLNDQPTPANTITVTTGNPDLKPEKADTLGVGAVFSPSFIPGLTMSADYWSVKIAGAIQQITSQQVVDSCFTGQISSLCGNITRDPTTGLISQIRNYAVNLAVQKVDGLDLEASYRFALSDLSAKWNGNFSVHALMTFYLKNYQNNTFNPATDTAGENSGTNPPNWKLNVTAVYDADPLTISLTGRAISSGTNLNNYIECTSDCPTATAANPTINNNNVPGVFYLDANISYRITFAGGTTADLFFAANNIFNVDPPQTLGSTTTQHYTSVGASAGLYDRLGTVLRAGVRFKL